MIYLKKIQSLHFLTNFQVHKQPLNPIITSTWLNSSTPYQPSHFSSSFLRPFYPSAQFHKESISTEKKRTKKPLCVFFQESVGLLEKSEQSESEDQTDNESENKGLKCKLRKLEEEVRILREKKKNEKANRVLENEGKGKKLYELFVNDEGKSGKSRKLTPLTMEDHTVYKELSPDMVMFVTHLYNEGYFKDSNFLPGKKFDITCFENSYARDFVTYAAEQFGRDQEITKWLSGSDLKKVALFGCPSIAKKTVFSAKKLRSYFRIQEDNVCSKCALKASCKFVNQSIWKGDMTNLHLTVVMRVITLYALESVPSQLVIPDEIKASVNRLLMDILRLSQTVP
ncbi:hypothetical protein RND71_015351 [Anisodus tanguticus]|uniref:Uncharacterized protein n=1 Tax=Anisodus tanguticus TaxID=243964 RepID=A0AAE1S780_9SOLA|nr:hypothetical protein RND71_015351 [Anisodus tanguticus]